MRLFLPGKITTNVFACPAEHISSLVRLMAVAQIRLPLATGCKSPDIAPMLKPGQAGQNCNDHAHLDKSG